MARINFDSIEEYNRAWATMPTDKIDGPSPGGAAAELKTSRQRIHYLIDHDYLDAVYVYDGWSVRLIMVTFESIERFKKNPSPKPGPKKGWKQWLGTFFSV